MSSRHFENGGNSNERQTDALTQSWVWAKILSDLRSSRTTPRVRLIKWTDNGLLNYGRSINVPNTSVGVVPPSSFRPLTSRPPSGPAAADHHLLSILSILSTQYTIIHKKQRHRNHGQDSQPRFLRRRCACRRRLHGQLLHLQCRWW